MANFSKEMMAHCAKTLKFLVPFMEKFSNPDYAMEESELDELQRQLREIVAAFMQSPANIRAEFRVIADDIDGLYRLDDLIKQARDGVIKLSMKTTVSDVQKRLAGIKVILNRELGTAPNRKPWGCLLLILILLVAGWFLKGTILSFVQSFMASKPEVESTDVNSENLPPTNSGEESVVNEEGTAESSEVEETVETVETAKTSDSAKVAESSEAEGDSGQSDDSAGAKKSAEADSGTEENSNSAAGMSDDRLPKTKASVRTWTDKNGKKLKGKLLFMRRDMIFLEITKGKNKTERGFRMDNFSEKDQKYLQKQFDLN